MALKASSGCYFPAWVGTLTSVSWLPTEAVPRLGGCGEAVRVQA